MVERAEQRTDVIDEQRLAIVRSGAIERETTALELDLERGQSMAELDHAAVPGF
jgi:hypothetical protein